MAVLVLSVGRDATLLAIRNLILSGAGYHVVAASTPEEFVERFYGGDFDAVVLCHTLPDDQLKRITELDLEAKKAAGTGKEVFRCQKCKTLYVDESPYALAKGR